MANRHEPYIDSMPLIAIAALAHHGSWGLCWLSRLETELQQRDCAGAGQMSLDVIVHTAFGQAHQAPAEEPAKSKGLKPLDDSLSQTDNGSVTLCFYLRLEKNYISSPEIRCVSMSASRRQIVQQKSLGSN
jgi:hypothetical protein